MDDTLTAILIAGGVAVGIAIGIGLSIIGVYIIHYNYRRHLMAMAEAEIERRSHITKLNDLMKEAVTPVHDMDYKAKWNKEHDDDYRISLEKQKLYEDELKNLQQPSLKDAIDITSKINQK